MRVLSRRFRTLFLARLRAAFAAGELRFSGALAALAEPEAFAARLGDLGRIEWVVYAKRPFAGSEQVLTYLGRYTHRVAIANSRLTSLCDGQVGFTWKDYRHHGKTKVMTLAADESCGGSCCTPCRTGFIASVMSGSWPMVIAPANSRCAAHCSRCRRQSRHRPKPIASVTAG